MKVSGKHEYDQIPIVNTTDKLIGSTEKTAAPTNTDDSSAGYYIGYRWTDTTTGLTYVCIDDTAGAAIWTDYGTDIATINNTLNGIVPANELIGGNVVWSGTGFVYDSTQLDYRIGGTLYTIPATTSAFTLAASDPTNDRIDLVYVNTAGQIQVITGTPAAAPSRPTLNDPSTELAVTFITVAAATTQPASGFQDIYLENAEWTVGGTGTIVAGQTTDPEVGSLHVDADLQASQAGTSQTLLFDKGSAYTLPGDLTTSYLLMKIRFVTALELFYRLRMRFRDASNNIVSNTIGWTGGFVGNTFGGATSTSSGVYKQVVVPLSNFNITASSVRYLELVHDRPTNPPFGPSSDTLTIYLDEVKIDESGVPAPITGVDAFDVNYAPTTSGDWTTVPNNVGDALDTLAADIPTVAGVYLPLAGGTMTGDIQMSTGTKVIFNNGGFEGRLQEGTLTGTRSYTFPNRTGILALRTSVGETSLGDASVTLTASQMIYSPLLTITPSTTRTLTTATAADIIAALPTDYGVGNWFDFTIIDLNVTNDVTLAANTGVTLVGHDTIRGGSATFRCRVDSGTTVSIYAISKSDLQDDYITEGMISSGSVTQAKIGTGAVTFNKIQDASAASVLLGRGSAAGAGDFEEITLGTGLTMTGTVLSATGSVGGSGTNNYITKWTPDGNTLGDSQLRDNGTGVSLGASPSGFHKFYVVNNGLNNSCVQGYKTGGAVGLGWSKSVIGYADPNTSGYTVGLLGAVGSSSVNTGGWSVGDLVGVIGVATASSGTDNLYGVVGMPQGSGTYVGDLYSISAYNYNTIAGVTVHAYGVKFTTNATPTQHLGKVESAQSGFYADTEFVMINSSGVFNFSNINALTADATPDGAADYVMTWDASTSLHKKVLLNNLPGGGGGGGGLTVTYSAAATVSAADGNLYVCNNEDMQITLPTAAADLVVGVKNINALATSPTMAVKSAAAAETIDGVDRSTTGYPISNQWDYVEFFTYTSDGGSTYDWGIR
jgi:hypothetical protein